VDDTVSLPSTVLLVEPPADDRAMYAMYLRARGFDPIEVDDADEAFARAAQMDLIVTGIRLKAPADGLGLIVRLRQHEPTRSLPIIVLSACAFEEDRTRAKAAGCDCFLAKPCSPDVLAAEARRLIARAAQLRIKARPEGTQGITTPSTELSANLVRETLESSSSPRSAPHPPKAPKKRRN
jgi:two-component system cell cycle response regulator DivK